MPSNPTRPAITGRKLRIAGGIILLAGFICGGLVYGLSKPPEILPAELASPSDFKKSGRDLQSNYGQVGTFSNALDNDMKDPTIQAGLIMLASIVIAGGCFFIAELEGRGSENRE